MSVETHPFYMGTERFPESAVLSLLCDVGLCSVCTKTPRAQIGTTRKGTEHQPGFPVISNAGLQGKKEANSVERFLHELEIFIL